MTSPKLSYQLQIIIASNKVLEIHKAYNKPLKDICEDVLFESVKRKHRHPHQQVLNFQEEG